MNVSLSVSVSVSLTVRVRVSVDDACEGESSMALMEISPSKTIFFRSVFMPVPGPGA